MDVFEKSRTASPRQRGSNKQFYDIDRYKQIAKDEYGIEIIFLAE